MSAKVGTLSEGFSTFFTLIGLLASMDSVMESKLLAHPKSLPTFLTFIGLFSIMTFLI
jgi:hypothetical protein